MQSTDFLVVGGGIAGLRAAIELAPHGRVLILTKAEPTESNTGYAQGGIAAAVGDDDSPALHGEDTIRAGDGLCDEDAVRVLVEDGPAGVRELMAWGAAFERDADGRLVLGREAAHSVRRVLHAGDATGREIGRVLWQKVRAEPSAQTIDHALVTELLLEGVGDRRSVTGVAGYDVQDKRQEYRARATLLATGGAGQVFSDTTNPSVATGDGIALAYFAGARVADLEFVQFHPTALNLKGAPRFLISEALRGEGARLVNRFGEPFMSKIHPQGDLAPRDVVARGIVREVDRTGGSVYLTLAHLDPVFVTRRFPTITAMCREVGLDLARDLIPVGPAAHYMMGGVDTDEWGRTSIPGLFAAGEVACTGLHGANRLASNSLLEGLVFGARAARAMLEPPKAAALKANRRMERDLSADARRAKAEGVSRPNDADVPTTRSAVQSLMWRSVGLFRVRAGMQDAVSRLDAAAALPAPATVEGSRQRNLVTVAALIARAALRREESRGGHFREDFPERDDIHWKVHLVDEQHG
ncbi:MAG TPA: L-aspartate oxidase [Vicinamibacterales bacterium]